MGKTISIKQGLDIRLAGTPSADLGQVDQSERITLYPTELVGLKPRLQVKEGDKVSRGSVLFYNKRCEAFKFRSPAAGTVEQIVLGPRRSLQAIIINTQGGGTTEELRKFSADELRAASKEEVLSALMDSGLVSLFQLRPFSRPVIADDNLPKSIFVNGMNNAPFRCDANVVVNGREADFQAGLNALTRITEGTVHLCLGADASDSLKGASNVEVSTFTGAHPSGNTSTHIHHLDPIAPGDFVWAISVQNVVSIGEFFLNGTIPSHKTIVAGGLGLNESARKHYVCPIGAPLSQVFASELAEGENRIIQGDVFSGSAVDAGSSVAYTGNTYTVIPEDRERHFMGWLNPGFNLFSTYRAFFSGVIGKDREWSNVGTSRRGSLRSMVATGFYDQYVPLNIMVDFLVRACIANDTDEAIKLGVLETDPEDFALCSVVCPSKTDFSARVRSMLNLIEEEGF